MDEEPVKESADEKHPVLLPLLRPVSGTHHPQEGREAQAIVVDLGEEMRREA